MWPPLQDEGTGVIRKKTIVSLKETTKEQEDVSWKTVIVEYEDQTFFGRLSRKSSFFTLDVVMKANKEDCEKYLIEASLVEAGPEASCEHRPKLSPALPPVQKDG